MGVSAELSRPRRATVANALQWTNLQDGLQRGGSDEGRLFHHPYRCGDRCGPVWRCAPALTTWTLATPASWSRRTPPTPRSGCTPRQRWDGVDPRRYRGTRIKTQRPATWANRAGSWLRLRLVRSGLVGARRAGPRPDHRWGGDWPATSRWTREFLTWSDGPPPPGGNLYRLRREAGQLLLMHVPGQRRFPLLDQ